MNLDRATITGAKFSQAADGFDRGDVLRHLEAIADALERGTQAAADEAEAIRTQATQAADEQLARVRAATAGLLERVASLELGIQDAQRSVYETAQRLAQRLEESAGPLVGTLRERADALAAEVDLIGTGIAAGPLTTAAALAADDDDDDDDDDAQAGTGLAPGDRADAIAQLDDEPPESAPARRGVEAARLVALNMALAGTAREDTECHLREELELADPSAILDEVYARTGDGAQAE